MSVKNSLTNEQLGARFDNSFALVNYAIAFAKNRLRKGHQQETNLACEVLDDIADNRDLLEFVTENDDDEHDDEPEIVEELVAIVVK